MQLFSNLRSCFLQTAVISVLSRHSGKHGNYLMVEMELISANSSALLTCIYIYIYMSGPGPAGLALTIILLYSPASGYSNDVETTSVPLQQDDLIRLINPRLWSLETLNSTSQVLLIRLTNQQKLHDNSLSKSYHRKINKSSGEMCGNAVDWLK